MTDVIHPTKKCRKCGEVRALPDFPRRAGARDGHRGVCKPCKRESPPPSLTPERQREYLKGWRDGKGAELADRQRAWHLKSRYGMTPDDYDRMFAEQGGACAACGRANRPRLVIDHDHKTGRVRALLCDPCNTTLGKYGDDPERLRALVGYLELHHVCGAPRGNLDWN